MIKNSVNEHKILMFDASARSNIFLKPFNKIEFEIFSNSTNLDLNIKLCFLLYLLTHSLSKVTCSLKPGLNRISNFNTKVQACLTTRLSTTEFLYCLRLEKSRLLRSRFTTHQSRDITGGLCISVLVPFKYYLKANPVLIGFKLNLACFEGLSVLVRFLLTKPGIVFIESKRLI